MADSKEPNAVESGTALNDNKLQPSNLMTPLISSGNAYLQVPAGYIRPLDERPRLYDVASLETTPLVDLKDLNGSNRRRVTEAIEQACVRYGFFQVVNHGVPENICKKMMEVAREFFAMPMEDKMQFYSEDPSQVTRLSTSFNVQKEAVLNWRDYLRHHCYPVEEYIHTWPSKPESYREITAEYCTEVRALVLRLLSAISESLGLESEFLDKALGNHGQHMAINYYPECPNPELTYGLPGHSDPNALTILLQDGVSGLQVLKDGKWLAVHPVPNAFVVNVGDQIQVLSNGKYRSAFHRAIVNSSKPRISIPTFYCPSPDAVIGPAPPLVDADHPAVYRRFTYKEFYHRFWSKDLEGESCLHSFT